MNNCRKIIIEYLVKNGYDGLVNIDISCGCITSDFSICEINHDDCIPAYDNGNAYGCNHFMTLTKPDRYPMELEVDIAEPVELEVDMARIR